MADGTDPRSQRRTRSPYRHRQVGDRFLANIPALRHLAIDNQLAEPTVKYYVNDVDTIWRQIVETMHLMTPTEQLHLRDFLAREDQRVSVPAWHY